MLSFQTIAKSNPSINLPIFSTPKIKFPYLFNRYAHSARPSARGSPRAEIGPWKFQNLSKNNPQGLQNDAKMVPKSGPRGVFT